MPRSRDEDALPEFEGWLLAKGLGEGTCKTYASNARTLLRLFGQHPINTNTFAAVAAQVEHTMPKRISALRVAWNLYRDFCIEGGVDGVLSYPVWGKTRFAERSSLTQTLLPKISSPKEFFSAMVLWEVRTKGSSVSAAHRHAAVLKAFFEGQGGSLEAIWPLFREFVGGFDWSAQVWQEPTAGLTEQELVRLWEKREEEKPAQRMDKLPPVAVALYETLRAFGWTKNQVMKTTWEQVQEAPIAKNFADEYPILDPFAKNKVYLTLSRKMVQAHRDWAQPPSETASLFPSHPGSLLPLSRHLFPK